MASNKFACSRCKKPHRDSYALQAHLDRKVQCQASEEIVEEPTWYCETCKLSCSTKGHLLAHLNSKLHARLTNGVQTNFQNPASTSDGNYSCQIIDTGKFIRVLNVEAFKKFRVRKSFDNPFMFHVVDLIASVTGFAFSLADHLFNRLKNLHSDLVTLPKMTNFGDKKGALGVDLRGVVGIVNVLPGEKAAAFRDSVCCVFVSHFDGDTALVDSVVKNIVIHEEREEERIEQWTRIFTEDADKCCDLTSATNVIDTRKTQCYFILPKSC